MKSSQTNRTQWIGSEQIDFCDCCEKGFFRKNLQFINFQILCLGCADYLETLIDLDQESNENHENI